MKLSKAYNIGRLREMARRRTPSFIFDMIEGGVEDEDCVRRNEQVFREKILLPRVLNDITMRDQSTTLFGRRWASPFGISPMAPAPVYRRGADEAMARAAVAANVPFVLSGGAGSTLERVREIAGQNAWFQLYGAKDRSISADMIRRAEDSGYDVLAVTVDTPLTPKRERHLQNGVTIPLKIRPAVLAKLLWEGVTHPAWAFDYVRAGGMPMLGNWRPYAPTGASAGEVADFFRSQSPSNQTWHDIETFRRLWPGKMVIKGVLNPADAVRLVEMGIDGITVSNHGGKIIDRAPAPLEMLPRIKAAVGTRAVVMMDGGVRRGADIAIARCLGADFVFAGRAVLYGVAAAGHAGAAKALEILRNELDLILATIGRPNFDELGPQDLLEN